MYEQHFGLQFLPFESSIKADRTFPSRALEKAATRIGHLVRRKGVGSITGESGSGKTTVCRKTAAQLHPGTHQVFYVSLSTGSVLDILNTIAGEFCLPARNRRAAARKGIQEQISLIVAENRKHPVLVFDEARLLRDETLSELRLMLAFGMNDDVRLTLILVGLSELDRRLSMTMHQSLLQRLIVRHQMDILGNEEIETCIGHRLALAGAPGQVSLFEPQAMEAIRLGSKGIPRLVNHLAHFSLAAAAGQGARQVACEHVEMASGELGI